MTTSISADEIIKQVPFPERKVLLEFWHPTRGDDEISHLIADAMAEFHKTNPEAETWPRDFIACNGIRIRFHSPGRTPQ